MQPRDVIFKLTESNPSLFDTCAVVASTVGSLQISISVGGLSRARFHRRLETPPTISFQGRMEHVFREIAIFRQNLGKR